MPEIAAGLTENRHQRSLSSTCRRDGIVGFDILKCVEPPCPRTMPHAFMNAETRRVTENTLIEQHGVGRQLSLATKGGCLSVFDIPRSASITERDYSATALAAAWQPSPKPPHGDSPPSAPSSLSASWFKSSISFLFLLHQPLLLSSLA